MHCTCLAHTLRLLPTAAHGNLCTAQQPLDDRLAQHARRLSIWAVSPPHLLRLVPHLSAQLHSHPLLHGVSGLGHSQGGGHALYPESINARQQQMNVRQVCLFVCMVTGIQPGEAVKR